MAKGQNIVEPVVDLIMGLWSRAERDFTKKDAREAFRESCEAILKGQAVEHPSPNADTPRDSAEWARYVAAQDCMAIKRLVDTISEVAKPNASPMVFSTEDSDSDTEYGVLPFRVRRRKPTLNPATDKRFKVNKTQSQIDTQKKNLEFARSKAVEVMDATRGYPLYDLTEASDNSDIEETPSAAREESSDIEYLEKRKRNSTPKKVQLPPLPMDYRLENEWIKKNIKSPDMLYSYVRAKAGDGVRWSSGLRKYFENNDFWEFAFDTLSSGGWCDSETNRPICNVSKYITKATIGEYERHEASKHSRFEGRFKTGNELLEYVKIHCYGLREEYKTEEYCDWFLQRMNDIGWRWNNGSTINNIPAQMAKMYEEFKEWCSKNGANLVGLNANQYGEVLRIQKAIDRGDWKPRGNGKFSALDLKQFLQQGE